MLYVAIIALIISLISLISTCVFAAKNYKKSKRLEFLQRRDHLFQAISDLNAKNSETHLISAKYEIVAVKKAGLRLQGEQAEQNMALIPAIKEGRENVERGIKNWDESIETLHSIYRGLTSEKDATEVERLISLVKVASDNLKRTNEGYLAALHILESTNQIIETKLAETVEEIKQINLDFERGMKNLGFEASP
jgi:hypothetical protein